MKPGENQVVAVDAMGGDGGIAAVVRGTALAIKTFGDEIGDVVFVGDEEAIRNGIGEAGVKFSRSINICNASQIIDMTEKPMCALRHRKDSSMFRALDLLKDGSVDGVLSCGNTGCLVAGGTLKLRMIPGVARPALASVIPAPANHFILIDVGANPATSIKSFVHNAVLGSLYYMAAINQNAQPRVGLLTIGTEEGKGGTCICEAHEMLKKVGSEINYCGLVEGFQLFNDVVDVVICDGFVGNILLKAIEGLSKAIKDHIRRRMKKNPLRMLGAWLAGGAFREIGRDLTADRYCGAPLLGLNGIVVKSHGSSSQEAIANALRLTFKLSKMNSKHFMSNAIERANALL